MAVPMVMPVPSQTFSPDPSLRNIVNGVVAQEFVNVHEYEEVGRVIMDNMIGKPAFTFTFRKKYKARTLGETSSVTIAPDRAIDSGLLFERFLSLPSHNLLYLCARPRCYA